MLIGSLISGVLGFFVGAFISVKFYQKCNEKIYFRYKIALNINDPDMVSSDDEDQELEGNDHNNNNYLVDKEESGTTSSSSYSSKESEENNENINEEEGEGEEEEEEEEGGEGEEEEDDDDEDDDNSNNRDESSTSGTGITDYGGDEELALFNSLYEIAYKISLNKKMKIFLYPQSCELACRFSRNNISGNAMQLSIDILSKGIKQYPKYIPLFIHFIYYKWLYELNKKKYFNSDAEEDFKCKAKLSKDRKPNFIIRYYYYHFTKYSMKEEKKLEEFEDKQFLTKFVDMENLVIKYHLITLDIIKKLFEKIKDNKNFDINLIIDYLMAIKLLKIKTLNYYKETMNNFNEEKNIENLYELFNVNVLNKNDIEERFDKVYQAYCEKNKGKPLLKNNINYSTHSIEKPSSTKDENELSDIEKLQNQLVLYKKKVTLRKTISNNDMLSKRIRSDVILKKVYNSIRQMSIGGAAQDEEYFNYYKQKIEALQSDIEDTFIPRFKTLSSLDPMTYPVIFQEGSYNDYNYLTSFEFSKFIESFTKLVHDYPFEDWNYYNLTEPLFNDYTYKFFIDNFKNNFNRIMDISLNLELSNYSSELLNFKMVWLVLNAILIILIIIFSYFAIKPVNKIVRKIFNNSLKSFKSIPIGSIEEIINTFKKDEELLSKTYDISPDYNLSEIKKIKNDIENSTEKNSIIIERKSYQRVQLLCYVITFIFIIILVEIPFSLKVVNIENSINLLFNMSSVKSYIYNICIYSYETLIQDRSAYFPGESEIYLSTNIENLIMRSNQIFKNSETISLIEFDSLSDYLFRFTCKTDENKCQNFNNYKDIFLNENYIKAPINTLIYEYVARSSAILYENKIKENKEEEKINEIYKEHDVVQKNAKAILKEFQSNEVIEYLSITTEYLTDALESIENILQKDLSNNIKNVYYPLLIILFTSGMIINIIIFRILIKKFIKAKIKEIDELIYIIFFAPDNIINISPKFKKFIETGEYDL
ncbi:hypothetical protein H8356DRAFT_925030 [Neocallimastix lanati (nom. inval.)]|nr:hypothetical protein H8356DRAFT_925030 [Neocallimastix sp. JGI-2020a]